MKIVIIAAIAANGVIGRTSKPCSMCSDDRAHMLGRSLAHRAFGCRACDDTRRVPCNDTPWGAYPEHEAHVDELTRGHSVVMGRRAWEARGGTRMPGRDNLVVTTMDDIGDGLVITADSLSAAIDWSRGARVDGAFVIGGAQLYAAALPLADELHLTLIGKEWTGDVRFPYALGHEFHEQNAIVKPGLIYTCLERKAGANADLTFTRWVRRVSSEEKFLRAPPVDPRQE